MKTQQDTVRTIVTAGAVIGLLAFALLAWAGDIDLPGTDGPSIPPAVTPVAPTPPASTPTTGMYARFDEVEGESPDQEHKNWIELDSFSWGEHNAGTMSEPPAGQTRRRGVVTVEDIVVTKEVDKSSPKLAEALCTGRVFKEVEIHLCGSYGSGGSQTFLVITLKDVIISSYEVGGSAWSDAVPTESISLNFTKIEQTYTEYSTSGTAEGQTEYGWDIVQNAVL